MNKYVLVLFCFLLRNQITRDPGSDDETSLSSMTETPARYNVQDLKGASAFIVGYTGEIGKQLVKIIQNHEIFSRLILIGRRQVDDPAYHSNITEQVVVDFDKLEESKSVFQNVRYGFFALGTTKKNAGSQDAQYKIDHDYAVNVAKIAKQAGCGHFHLVSSKGADVNSWFFYMRLKGEVERDVAAFDFPRLSIYRPGFLMCDRVESRPTEYLMRKVVMNPLSYVAPTKLSISTETVAKAMVAECFRPASDGKKVEIWENTPLHSVGAEFDANFPSAK